ncbi:hypothetical protein EJV46_03110 [Roseococcus sp. SYP-B2431]|uniref:hypothetical protein n=1 Tax=Roseococcus sp. SYP-B2431 TaxID=2496640 RepID=UPI00103FD2E2|nr:hypothetical protein [Roseococcus sp. SYP-B2431]TCH99679.1 hypothetical protein EJV46_03110 [Roseococcus sp. SYP-B2431]
MSKLLTHLGRIEIFGPGPANRIPEIVRLYVKVRETPNFWFCESGIRFSKAEDGRSTGNVSGPNFKLDLNSLESLGAPQKGVGR